MMLKNNSKARIRGVCLVFLMLTCTTQANESPQELDEGISVKQINSTIVDHAHWSPDQEYFAVSSNFSGHWQIYNFIVEPAL